MTARDPIVITGMAIEAPGSVDDLDDYADALFAAEELLGPMPRNRGWPLDELATLGDIDGWSGVPDRGGFLSDATTFDPSFFGITPREAVAMDPQQRVGLRVAWRALEHAGLSPGAIDGSDAGCFIGASAMEYGPRAAAISEYSGHRVAGTALGAVSGRISHCLGLAGPSMTVDTACASSLTAISLAANAITSGESDWAIAGGVCVMGSPGAFYEFSKNQALAHDGHLRAFAAGATGTVWGEGAAMVILDTRSRALELGHRIYGELLAVRTNHNAGRGNGHIVVPAADAQRRVIASAVRAAGIDPADVGMVEGHGTGTPVGDPIELAALAQTYGTDPTHTTWLGSVKSNTGHTQAASGALSLIKVLMCARRGEVAPTLYAEDPTAEFGWEHSNLQLPTTKQRWTSRPSAAYGAVRYGAVSSFGVSGSNAHAIVAVPAI